MRNFIIVIVTILSGLVYGWCIVKYPITAQIISGGIGLSFLFIAMVALYKLKQEKDESKH
jgi:multisubunit Na+/H+ antiporter MnhB subunit